MTQETTESTPEPVTHTYSCETDAKKGGILHRLRLWRDGYHVCIKCGISWSSHTSFGFGDMICPNCHDGEQPWRWPRSIRTGNLRARERRE